MSKTVKLHNLRVNGNRVPQDIWAAAAEILLPGPSPSASDIKHGKSKSAVLKRICATDKVMRKRATDLCAELMSKAAKTEAREAGWAVAGAVAPPDDDGRFAFWLDYYKQREAEYARCFADECGCGLADQLHGRTPFPYRNEDELVAAILPIMNGTA